MVDSLQAAQMPRHGHKQKSAPDHGAGRDVYDNVQLQSPETIRTPMLVGQTKQQSPKEHGATTSIWSGPPEKRQADHKLQTTNSQEKTS